MKSYKYLYPLFSVVRKQKKQQKAKNNKNKNKKQKTTKKQQKKQKNNKKQKQKTKNNKKTKNKTRRATAEPYVGLHKRCFLIFLVPTVRRHSHFYFFHRPIVNIFG
jgi:ATPase subunit of ABC transporter with duplicated ATPase domains